MKHFDACFHCSLPLDRIRTHASYFCDSWHSMTLRKVTGYRILIIWKMMIKNLTNGLYWSINVTK